MIEILMAVWNGEKYLREQIDSILRQDMDGWMLTISDDGSTDGSEAILDEYVRAYPDKIRRLRSGRKFGSAREHFFYLMEHSEGDCLFFCDQDDVWHPDKLRKFTSLLRQGEEKYGRDTPLLVFSDQAVVDEKLSPLSPSLMWLQQQDPNRTDYRNILFQNIVTGCTCAINRPLAKLSALCLRTKDTVMHDWWLALVAARFGHLLYLPESTIDYRQHGDNSIGAKDTRSLQYRLHKITHRSEMERNRANKKNQAQVFLDTYLDRLTEDDKKTLASYATPRSPLLWKVSYLRHIDTWKRRLGFLVMH